MSEPLISLITLSRDNPGELLRTVGSVARQTVSPDVYIVVDSSSGPLAPRMQAIAESGGAKYFWVEPKGIYPAMVQSLEFVPKDSFCWWINSSDWLAGSRSVELARTALLQADGETTYWHVGQLLRLRPELVTFHRTGLDGDAFLEAMRAGTVGFPHPSTLFWAGALREVSPFNDGLRIASDYATALRFGKRFGAPRVMRSVLSVHAPTGYSAEHPVRNLLERSRARKAVSDHDVSAAEFLRVVRGMFQGVFRAAFRGDTGSRFLDDQVFPLGENTHFCAEDSATTWPLCCTSILDTPLHTGNQGKPQ